MDRHVMETRGKRPPQRRTTAALLKQQILSYLTTTLPSDWTCQPLSPAPRPRGGTESARSGASADVLVISPRGRCHFLFIRAPADRWWDGGLRQVAAEEISTRDAQLLRQLRAAGHKARAVREGRDLLRALRSWGCPLTEGAGLGHGRGPRNEAPSAARGGRPTLHLNLGGDRADG